MVRRRFFTNGGKLWMTRQGVRMLTHGLLGVVFVLICEMCQNEAGGNDLMFYISARMLQIWWNSPWVLGERAEMWKWTELQVALCAGRDGKVVCIQIKERSSCNQWLHRSAHCHRVNGQSWCVWSKPVQKLLRPACYRRRRKESYQIGFFVCFMSVFHPKTCSKFKINDHHPCLPHTHTQKEMVQHSLHILGFRLGIDFHISFGTIAVCPEHC